MVGLIPRGIGLLACFLWLAPAFAELRAGAAKRTILDDGHRANMILAFQVPDKLLRPYSCATATISAK